MITRGAVLLSTTPGLTKLVDTGGVNQAVISAAGAQKVDGSAVTQPVSIASNVGVTGTVNAVAFAGGLPLQASSLGELYVTPIPGTGIGFTTTGTMDELILRELRRMNLLMAIAFGVDIPMDNDLEDGYAA